MRCSRSPALVRTWALPSQHRGGGMLSFDGLRKGRSRFVACALAAVISLGNVLAAPPLMAQTGANGTTEEQRQAEIQAAWNAAAAAGVSGPAEVPLADQGSFSVPAGSIFI